MSDLIHTDLTSLVSALDGIVSIDGDTVTVHDAQAVRETLIDQLVYTATFAEGDAQAAARWLIRQIGPEVGAFLASIHDLYMAAAAGKYHNVTTPAINVRGMSYDFAQAIFKAGLATDTRQVLFELAKSENGYTLQTPAEFVTSILAAAIKVGWQGPVMIQGDHFQINPKKWAADPEAELENVRSFAMEALAAGYGNIDIDSSTIVDYSVDDLDAQQKLNYTNTAYMVNEIRKAQPAGMTISLGCEIGEVGTTNSTVADLDAFMKGFDAELATYGDGIVGLSKVSVQTGTSHGGTVLPDGTIADVAVDFKTLGDLSVAARTYGLGGSVQHGASTLPEEAFGKFAEADAIEVHLATAYQNIFLDSEHLPAELRDQMYAWLAENCANERKEGQTDAQFYYKTRKKAFGPFKKELWSLPQETKNAILGELQPRFELVMRELGVAGQSKLVDEYIKPVKLSFPMPDALKAATAK